MIPPPPLDTPARAGRLPALSPTAKAYAAAAATFVVTVLSATLPLLDGTAATLTTIVLSVAGTYGLVYAVPNKNYPQRAKPRAGVPRVVDVELPAVPPILRDDGTPNPPPAPPPV